MTFRRLLYVSLLSLPTLATFTICGSAALAQSQDRPAPDATISIDTQQIVGPVNRLVFGANISASDNRGIFSPLNGPTPQINTAQGMWDPQLRAVYPVVREQVQAMGIEVMRYPGGCLAHNYDWRKTVGPVDERPDWQFGLDEYMALCSELGTEPLITMSMYVLPAEELAQHAADMVEYLNAPATSEHPWAMKRAEWGHPEPYGVTYFELGNESIHGNHNVEPFRQFSGAQYARWAKAMALAMKRVDPSIQLGLITQPGNGQSYDSVWSVAAFRGAGDIADFMVVHIYAPVVGKETLPQAMVRASMAANDQVEVYLGRYRDMMMDACGREVPLAVTEFNIGAIQDEPMPYRFSFAAALRCADFYRVVLKPENRVLMTNYWQLVNGYWGVFDTEGNTVTETRPALALFRLWGQHLGDQLCSVTVQSPDASFGGGEGLRPAVGSERGDYGPYVPVEVGALSLKQLQNPNISGTLHNDGVLEVAVNELTGGQYLKVASVDASQVVSTARKLPLQYQLSFEACWTPDDPATGRNVTLGMDLVDSRSWEATHSGVTVTGVESATDWEPFSAMLYAMEDARNMDLKVRLLAKKTNPVSGNMKIRNIRLEAREAVDFTAYPTLTASSSLSEDGRTLYLMVFNKDVEKDLRTSIHIEGFDVAETRYWQINGDPLAIETVEESASGETLKVDRGTVTHTFPACSMTAIEFSRRPVQTRVDTPDASNF